MKYICGFLSLMLLWVGYEVDYAFDKFLVGAVFVFAVGCFNSKHLFNSERSASNSFLFNIFFIVLLFLGLNGNK